MSVCFLRRSTSLFLLVLVSAFLYSLVHIDGKLEMVILDEVEGLQNSGYWSAIIDTRNSALYFANFNHICKYSISSTVLSFVSCKKIPSATFTPSLTRTAVIDEQNSVGYYITTSSSTQVCRVGLSSASFQSGGRLLVSCIEATYAGPPLTFTSAVIDTRNSAAYFGTQNQPALVCKYRISPSDFSFVSCVTTSSEVYLFYSAVIDPSNSAAYFGTSGSFGRVCKFSISSSNFAFESCIQASGMHSFNSAVVDTQNSAAYFGTAIHAGPGNVCKYSISPNNFALVSCISTTSSGSNQFVSAVIDTTNSAAYFGTSGSPGKVCKFSTSPSNFAFISCITAPYGVNNFGSAVIDAQNAIGYFGSGSYPGRAVKVDLAAFACNPNGQLTISQNHFPQSKAINFVALAGFSVSISSATVGLITFLKSIGGSSITLRNVKSTSRTSLIRFVSSTPFSSSSTLTFEGNQFDGQYLVPPFNVQLTSSSWSFRCNKWLNGYTHAFENFAKFVGVGQVIVDCHTFTPQQTATHTQSLSASQSTSVSLSESVFCFNLNQQQCLQVGAGNCRFCSDRDICVPREQDCNCTSLSKSLCPLATGCKYCDLSSICVEDDIDCSCTAFDESFCRITSACRWCPNFQSCLTSQEQCFCSTLGATSCTGHTQNKCTYCHEREICLPTTDFNKETCACIRMNSSNCQTSKCSWCDNYQTCSRFPSWNCDCTSLSNTSASSCSVDSNGHCKLCQEESVCVDAQKFTCRCENFTEHVCGSTSSCRWCDDFSSCTISENDECNCYLLRGQQACDHNSNGKCHFCPNFDSCFPVQEDCYCSSLSQYPCTSHTRNKCTYCRQQEICLPTTEVDQNTCACPTLNSSNCQTSKCSWCDNYQTCSHLPGWDCDCTTLSNTSASSCSADSNNHCKLCSEETVCVDAKKFNCRCENFTQSVCDSTSSCKWCDTLNSCTLPENKNCTCNWLRFKDSCNRNSNNKCSWCATSSDFGTAKHNSLITNFNYCISNDGEDQCQCSYLSPSLCSAANDPSLNKNLNLSTSCRYCPTADICVHPGNDECECGNFATEHACSVASLCSWKDPVLTSDGAVQYCSAASVKCSPVMCEGILTQYSCDSSGCKWNAQTARCESGSVCFNFFIAGFTPQPMLLWVIGLLKDALVVFLIGAYANIFTRPIKNFLTSFKKNTHPHIKQKVMEETVYIYDEHCRDDLPIDFPAYVQRVCDTVFACENDDDLIDEGNRLALFNSVAYTLFDNMIWVDIDSPEGNAATQQEETDYRKRFGLSNDEPSQQEMKSLTSHHEVDVTDHQVQKNDDDDDAQTMQQLVEHITAAAARRIKRIHDPGLTRGIDVNTRAQFFGRFAAAVAAEHERYVKTNNVALLKIKVFLTAQDFESSVALASKVDESLIKRASAYVFYDQSRSRKVCAAAAADTFPPATTLIYYSVALLFLFVSSMITVSLFKNFRRMVQLCDDELSPSASNSNVTANATSHPGSNDETVIDGSYLTGAYFLLGFRLLNSSAFSTAILVFVKVVRGIYQRFSGIYTLSLQERIPLMALYSDRFTHVMLFLYAALVLPFALCGPTYGSSFGVYCWVPVFIAAAVLICDALVLYVFRRFLAKGQTSNESDSTGYVNEQFEDFLDFSSNLKEKILDSESVAISPEQKKRKSSPGEREAEKSNKVSEKCQIIKEKLPHPEGGEVYSDSDNAAEEQKFNQEKAATKQSPSPLNLWNAILIFIVRVEIPVIVISLALQLSFNYAALLHYGDSFGLNNNYGGVYGRDYDSRSVSCVVSMFENDVSSFVSGLSSFVPFM